MKRENTEEEGQKRGSEKVDQGLTVNVFVVGICQINVRTHNTGLITVLVVCIFSFLYTHFMPVCAFDTSCARVSKCSGGRGGREP